MIGASFINEELSKQDKVDLIYCIFEVAYSDNNFHFMEKHLIDKRDIYMSTNIVKLFRSQKCDRIVAIVGEGHVAGMAERLTSINPKIIRLSDLLQNNDNSVSFSIEI